MAQGDPIVELIRSGVERSGRSVTELATRIGVSRAALNNWRAGHRSPTLPNLRAFCDAVGLPQAQADAAFLAVHGRPNEAA